MKRLILGLPLLLLVGCNSSPGQFEGRFTLSLCTIDNRQYFDGASGTNGVATPATGHGSNARVNSESIQSMVLYKSPMSASSNSTDVSASVPLVK